jgi:hypothetical protein
MEEGLRIDLTGREVRDEGWERPLPPSCGLLVSTFANLLDPNWKSTRFKGRSEDFEGTSVTEQGDSLGVSRAGFGSFATMYA